jgi:hypothetical protein
VLIKEFRLALSVVLVKALCKVWLKKVLWASWIKSKLKVCKMPTAKLLLLSKPTVQLKLEIKQLALPKPLVYSKCQKRVISLALVKVSQLSVLVHQAAQALAGYGQLGRESDIQNAQLLDTIGRSQQQEGQQGLDLGYQEYLTKQGFTQNQIANMSNMLQGLPVANAGNSQGTTNTVGTPATPGFGQQVLGAGLTGLSLYKAFKDGGLVR